VLSEQADETDNTENLTSTDEEAKEQLDEETKVEIKERPKRKGRQSKKRVDKSDSEEEIQNKMTICDEVSDEKGEVKDDSSK
ncbi:serine/threonine-protein phosphatase, partial [Vibrio sp. 10N.261.45.F1]